MTKKKPDLKALVNVWLKENRPKLYVDDHGSIGLVEEKGKKSQAFGTVVYGWVYSDHVRFFNPKRFAMPKGVHLMMISVKAADPKFFDKLAKYL